MLIWHFELQTCADQIVFGAHAQGLVKILNQNMLICSSRWKDKDYSPDLFNKRVVDKLVIPQVQCGQNSHL